MRRWFGFLVMAAVFIAAAACSPPTQGKPPAEEGKKALFVGRDSGGDGITIKRLKGLGFEVEVVADKELVPESALQKKLVFVSSTVNSGKVGKKLKDSPVPVIYAESQNIGDIEFSGKTSDFDNGDFTGKTVVIKDGSHPIAAGAGLKGNVDIYKQDGKIGFVVPSPEGVIVAAAPDDERKAVICAFEKGAKNLNGEPAPARRAYFYLVGGEEINQSDDGWKLFDATVQWVTDGKQ